MLVAPVSAGPWRRIFHSLLAPELVALTIGKGHGQDIKLAGRGDLELDEALDRVVAFEKELADEKGRAYGAFVVSLRSSLGIANALAQFEFNGLGVAGLDGIKAQYDAVTKEQVDAAIRKYFDLDHAVTVVAGSLTAK